MPEIVNRLRPLVAPFLGSAEVMTGPSKENGLVSVPTVAAIVTAPWLFVEVMLGDVNVTRVPVT